MASSLVDSLFSKVQQRVLAQLFGYPERSFYASELIRFIQSGSGAVQRELARLEKSGLVNVTRTGNQKFYQANRQSPIFDELHGLVLKTVGLAGPLQEALQPYAKKIKAAFIYGSVAKGEDTAKSDIDLMVIGNDLSYADLYTGLQKAENILHRSINPNFVTPADWKHKLAQKNTFIAKINSQPKIFVFGSKDDIH